MEIFKIFGDLPAPENAQSWHSTGSVAYSTCNNYIVPDIYLMPRAATGEYDLHADFDFLNTNLDQNVGLVFGYTDPKNYWLAVYSTGFKEWSIRRVVSGIQETFDVYPEKIADDVGRYLTIRVRDHIELWINGTKRLSCSGTTEGLWGLYSLGTGRSGPMYGVHCTMLCKTQPDMELPKYAVYGPDSVPPGFTSRPFTIYPLTNESLNIIPYCENAEFIPETIRLGAEPQTFVAKGITKGKDEIEFLSLDSTAIEPLDFEIGFLPPRNEASWKESLKIRSSSGSKPYVKGTGYALDYDDHYDPEEVFIRVQEYDPDTNYSEQIEAGKIRFRNRAVLNIDSMPGDEKGVQQWHRFTTGILSGHRLSPDPLNIDAMNILIPEFFEPGLEENWSHVGVQREAALLLQAIIDRYRIGLGDHPMRRIATNICLEHQRQWYYERDQYGVFLKPFMGALNCRALIAAWEEFADPRIPPTISRFCDYILETCYADGAVRYRDIAQDDPRWIPIESEITEVQSQQVFRANLPEGNFAHAKIVFDGINDGYHLYRNEGNLIHLTSYTPNVPLTVGMKFRIQPTGLSDDLTEGNGFTNELNMLLAPAFAWAYWHTKEQKYYYAFHDLFNGQPIPAGTQKVYNQCGLWITKGLTWLRLATETRNPISAHFGDTAFPTEEIKIKLVSKIKVGDIVRYFEPGKSSKLGVVRNKYYRVQLFLDEADPSAVLSRYVTDNGKLLQKLDYYDNPNTQ